MRVPLGPLTRLLHSKKTEFGVSSTSSDTDTNLRSWGLRRSDTAVVVTSTGTVKQRAMSSVPTAFLLQTHVTSINVDAKMIHQLNRERTSIKWDVSKEVLTTRFETLCGAVISPQWAVFLTWPEARHWMENRVGGMWQWYGDRTSCKWCMDVGDDQ